MAKRTGAKRASHWITDSRRGEILNRDNYTCLCCGADLHEADCDGITLDHIICHSASVAEASRPDNRNSNLVTMCAACNSERGAKAWRDYYPGGAWERVERHLAAPTTRLSADVVTERRAVRYVRKVATHATKAA